MTSDELNAIKARNADCSEDVPALIAEVERLKALLKLAYHAIYSDNVGLLRANLKNDIEAVLEE